MRLFRGESRDAARGPEGAPAEPPDALRRASERIEEVRAAIARAAGEIRADAETLLDAPESANEREQIVVQLLRSLADRAERLDGEARQLAGILGRGVGALATLEAGSEPPPGESTGPPQPPPQRPHASTSPGPGGATEEATSGGVRLFATQMAVAGSSRDEIEERLRAEFEVEDVDAMLDEILGSVAR